MSVCVSVCVCMHMHAFAGVCRSIMAALGVLYWGVWRAVREGGIGMVIVGRTLLT